MTRTVIFSDSTAGYPKLKKAKEQAHQNLPPITNQQRKRLATLDGYAAYRMCDYLLANQGARTDEISPAIAIRNPPDTAMKMRAQINSFGLDIDCQLMKTKNRYGKDIRIGVWFLTVIDFAKWFGTKAANDESA
jgi:hypothetical protein